MFGVLLGFTASSWLLVPQLLDSRRRGGLQCAFSRESLEPGVPEPPAGGREHDKSIPVGNSSGGAGPGAVRPQRFLYVGVMTAKKYLDTRAVAAYKTWARSIPGKVEFFSSAGSGTVQVAEPIPVVSLAGVDDSYPPQKKSFMMLKYIHDHFLDQYEWFMRADDDVYIRGGRGRHER